jgi:hypothetical protein
MSEPRIGPPQTPEFPDIGCQISGLHEVELLGAEIEVAEQADLDPVPVLGFDLGELKIHEGGAEIGRTSRHQLFVSLGVGEIHLGVHLLFEAAGRKAEVQDREAENHDTGEIDGDLREIEE